MRRKLIAGNWKMHKTVAEATALVRDLLAMDDVFSNEVEAIVCPPFTALPAVAPMLGDQRQLGLGAQNMHEKTHGAFTGEIAAPMLVELGVRYVILGHSERRTHFNETDASVNRKVKTALEFGLVPIVAVGETHDQHERGEAVAIIKRQTAAAFEGIADEQLAGCVVAYEPIWAIGTGLACDAPTACSVMGEIRATVGIKGIRILYGGSVTPENIAAFVKESDIDGALVGGASLNAASFAALIKESRSVVQAH